MLDDRTGSICSPPASLFSAAAAVPTDCSARRRARQKIRARVVMKFGGTSVANLDLIRKVAARAVFAREADRDVVIVVSAMSGETDRLLSLGRRASANSRATSGREMDVLAATGEQLAAALTALAIQSLGVASRSFLAHQLPIRTDSAFGDAAIEHIEPEALLQSLRQGEIPVVAGFQGIDAKGFVTTLGRGGSDTTAVALAAAIGAEACEIFTDVDGVYDADPRQNQAARKFAQLPYRAMLELAVSGAKVLHDKCVARAALSGIPVYVRSSFSDEPGTWVGTRPEGYVETFFPERTFGQAPSRPEEFVK